MTLDPQVQSFIKQFQPLFQEVSESQSIQKARDLSCLLYQRSHKEPVAKISEEVITGPGGDLHLRIYNPKLESNLPVLIFFHGGGWVFGSLDTADALCRRLANKTEFVLVSVEYRLAPEHPFPAALEDAYEAVSWVQQNAQRIGADPHSMFVGGESAGGNLAAAVCLMARDRKAPQILGQLLLYPIMDADFNSPSYVEFAKGFLFERSQLMWCWDLYAPKDRESQNAYLRPLQAENFQELPPAVIITAEFDPLRHEAESFAQKLREAEVAVIFKRFKGMIHGFLAWDEYIDQAKSAVVEIADALKMALRMGLNI